MDDKELVEVWRAEFHEIMSRDRPFSSKNFFLEQKLMRTKKHLTYGLDS